MSNTINCPSCQRTLRVPEDLLGQLVKCPSCGQTFTAVFEEAPPPRREAPLEQEPVEEEPPRRRSSRRQDDDEDDYRQRPRRTQRYEDEDDDENWPRRRRRYIQNHHGPMILTFGIIAFLFVFFPPMIIFGPLAWILGSQDIKEIRARRMDPEGLSATETGRLCGMIATIIGAVLLLGCCFFYMMLFAGAAGSAGLR